jgi:uncharacterized protein YegL
MTWFPHFLNGWPAAIAAAVAIPALLVLYFLKLRRREFSVPSTLLWRKAIQDLQVNAPFQKLRKNLLLFLQLLLLAALLLALARPVLNYTPGAGPRAIILIDHSASMSATDMPGHKSRLDEAKRRAKDLVGTMGRDGAAMVIAFDDSAQTVAPFTSDVRVLRNAIDAIEPTDRKTRLESAYRLADAQAAFSAGENTVSRKTPDVYLFSDGRAADADKVSVEGNLHFEQIGAANAHNIAVVAMNARRNYESPTEVQVFARLANFGPDPVRDVQVEMTVDGKPQPPGFVDLLPENYTEDQRRAAADSGFVEKDSIEFPSVQLTSSAVIKVEHLNTEGDALSADDSAVVVVPPPKILSVLLVTDGNWFLEQGLRVQKLKVLDTMFPQEYHQLAGANEGGKQLPKPYDVVVFDRDDDLKPEEIPRTGAVIYFGCVPPGLDLKAAVDPAGQRVIVDNNEVLDWKREHPILKHLSFSKLYAAHEYKLLPTLDSEILVEGTNAPMMVLQRSSRAIHLVVPFDILPSNFPLLPIWPAFLNQTLQYMALGTEMDIRPSYEPGVTLRIPRLNLAKLDPTLDAITITGPMGKMKVKVPPTGDFVLPALNQVGLYKTDPPIPQYENIAVNLLDSTESNLLPAEAAPGSRGQEKPVKVASSRLELWWWLVAALALPLLIIEWWVYTRRVHL